jgi:ABC-type Mn2+/Zn2+ transport system ATPase subunit
VILLKKSVVAFGKTEDVFTPENISRTFEGMLHRLAIGHREVDINH